MFYILVYAILVERSFRELRKNKVNSDIRVATTFYVSLKRRRLQQDLGAEGVLALLDLWLYAAMHQADGDLTNLSAEEIALAANYPNNPENFLAGLVKVGFVDENIERDGSISRKIHHWEIHNAWAANATKRSEAARELASKRWDKKLNRRHATRNAVRIQPVCDAQCDAQAVGNAPLPNPFPFPSPLPNPTPKQQQSWDEGELNPEMIKKDFEKLKKL
jgi:hypothetical protein